MGGFVGAWAAARGERSAQLRNRMLDVADAYVVALAETLGFIDWQAERVSTDEAERRLPQIDVLVARIDLLFMPDSAVAEHASEAVARLRLAIRRPVSLKMPPSTMRLPRSVLSASFFGFSVNLKRSCEAQAVSFAPEGVIRGESGRRAESVMPAGACAIRE